jgi:hypothetical protein
MEIEQGWNPEFEDCEEPEEEPEFWEEDELTPAELARLYEDVPDDELTPREVAELYADIPGYGSAAGAGRGVTGAGAAGGVSDVVAAVLAVAGDPAGKTDAQLVDSLRAWHAVTSMTQGRELRATAELLRRRRPRVWDRRADRAETRREELDGAVAGEAAEPSEPAGPGQWAGRAGPGEPAERAGPEDSAGPGGPGGGAADAADDAVSPERAMPTVVASREAMAEIALALTATEYAAQVQAELAAVLWRRLPRAFVELEAGRSDLARIKVLAESTQFLSDEDAGKVDALLAPKLGEMTTGELRDKARKAVIRIDPGAAEQRRKRAERKARFVLYGNDDQTATAAIEKMPAHLGAAAKARVNAVARAAKAAGMSDPMPLLEAKVATGLLLGTLPFIPPPAPDGGPSGGIPDDENPGGSGPDGSGPAGEPWDGGWPAHLLAGPVQLGNDEPDSGSGTREARAGMAWPALPATAAAAAPGCASLPAWLRPKNSGRIRLTVPWRTLTGIGPEPGELSWTGPVTPAQARELAVAAATDPGVTWRIIVTDDDGHAIAITDLRTGRAPGARTGTGTKTTAGIPGLVSEVTITIQQSLAAALESGGKACEWTERALARLGVGSTSFARADFGGANFGKRDFGAANFGKADLGADFGGATIGPAKIAGADFAGANFAELADLLAKAVGAAYLAAAEAADRARAGREGRRVRAHHGGSGVPGTGPVAPLGQHPGPNLPQPDLPSAGAALRPGPHHCLPPPRPDVLL